MNSDLIQHIPDKRDLMRLMSSFCLRLSAALKLSLSPPIINTKR